MENCTISDICIDYLIKNNFDLFIERTSDGSVNEWDWIAKRTDLHIYATDPVRLVALYMIREDWINDRNYYKNGAANQDYQDKYPQITAAYIADAGNTYNYAVDKLVQWGYTVSISDDSVEFSEYCNLQIAEKNGEKYLATDPLRLLGFVAMIQEYGEKWSWSDVVRSFSLQPAKKEFYMDL